MYPGNAPFPLTFGIPNTEPLSYHTSPATMTIGDQSEIPNRINYYHQPPERQFEFTLDNPRLTLKQRQFYEKNGFVVIPRLVPEDVLDDCVQRFKDIVDGKVPKGGMIMMRDVSVKNKDATEFVVNKVQDFLWDDELSKHATFPEVLNVVECFTGPDIRAMHTMLINKPPDSGKNTSRHPMHQVRPALILQVSSRI